MKKFGLFIGLLLGALLMAGQALAATAPVGNFYLPPSPDADGYYQIKWRPSPTAGVTYTLEEATNAGFTTGLRTAYSGTATYTYIGTPVKNVAGSYYYRIKATLGGVDSTTLTAATPIVVSGAGLTVGKPARLSFPPTDADGKFRVIIGMSATAGAGYELEQCTGVNTGCVNIYTGPLTYKDVVIASNGTVYFRARATKAGMTSSAYIAPATGTVVTIPGAVSGSDSYAAGYAAQSADWAAGRHANADTAPSLNLLATNSCNRCHNPNYETTTRVGCEACHGAGVADPATTIVAAAAACAKCHTGNHYSNFGSLDHALYTQTINSCMGCHDPHTLAAIGDGLAPTAAKPLIISNLVLGTDTSDFITATFNVSDGTNPVTGLTSDATSIYLAGLLPGATGSVADQWSNWGYTVATTDTLAETSTPGEYLLTTNKKIADAPTSTTTQRALITLNAGAVYERANAVYDFATTNLAVQIPSGKEVVNDASCKECHGYGVTIHSFGRNDTRACVVCHSPLYNATIATNEADMVTMIHKIHNKEANVLGNLHWTGHGDGWGIVGTGANAGKTPVANFVYPDNMLNCTTCHNTVAQADHWKTKPSMTGCNTCHENITFDSQPYVGIRGGAGQLHAPADSTDCNSCHWDSRIPQQHTPTSLAVNNADLRPIAVSISSANVDENGGVTVSFHVTNNGVAKTDLTAATFTLAKLVPSTATSQSYWQSYLSKVRTKGATTPPVIQGRTEAVNTLVPASSDGGILTNMGSGDYTFKFALLNADVPGDIRTITHAHNNSSTGAAEYQPGVLPTMVYPVAYEPNLTHRIAIGVTNNKTNAFIDFVPGNVVAETRKIVSWETACKKCHGTSQRHAGYTLEYCTGCHNKNSYDPYSGVGSPVLTTSDNALAGTQSVELGTIIHKIHMGRLLPSVQAGGTYTINGTHDYSKAQYPSGVPALNPAGSGFSRTSTGAPVGCKVCHDETNVAMTESANWRNPSIACGNCHDSSTDLLHINGNAANCVICHSSGDGKVGSVEESHYGK